MSSNLKFPIVLNGPDIYSALPHRYPFLMLDSAEILDSSSCNAIHNVSFGSGVFVGHFPGNPVLPGVLQIEAMAQSAGLLKCYNTSASDHLFVGIDKARFHRQVIPGDVLQIQTKLIRTAMNVSMFESQAFVRDEIASSCSLKLYLRSTEEYTLAIIKPDALKFRDHICQMINANGLEIASYNESGIKVPAYTITRWLQQDAEKFYAEHEKKSFFKGLCTFMSSGDVLIMVLKGKNAIEQWRSIIGPTDPAHASPSTIRGMYGTSIDFNAVHGSDSSISAKKEIEMLFPGCFF